MSESKDSGATARPWNAKRAGYPSDGEFDYGISAVIDGKPYCIAETFGRCSNEHTLNAESNAALIVAAVNSYDSSQARISELEKIANAARDVVEASEAEWESALTHLSLEIMRYDAALSRKDTP